MDDFTGLIPHLFVNGGAAAIDFYAAAFGAVEVSRTPGEDGRLMHAAMRIGDSMLFLSDDFPELCGGVSRAPAGPAGVTLHLCVPDVDAAMARAAAAGAAVTMPPADVFWGDRYGQLRDPFGHAWSFSHKLAAARPQAA